METSHSSRNSTPNQYAALLNTVSEMRNDLEKAMNKIHSLEDQNRVLAGNYQIVKDELLETRKSYQDVKESYLQAVADKFEAERQHESFMERLKKQLDEKTLEFEQIRDKLIPHDIDQLRIKVQEELEIHHKQEVRTIENDLEHQRDHFHSVKRDYERMKVELEMLVQNQQKEIEALKNEREAVELELRKELLRQKEVDYTPNKDEQIRTLRSKVKELTHVVELVKEEAQGVRQENDNISLQMEQLRANFNTTSTQLRGQLASVESAKSSLEEKASRIHADAERKETLIRQLKTTVEEQTERLDATTKKLEATNKMFTAQRDEQMKEIESIRANHDLERAELQEKIDLLNEKVMDREESLRRLQREHGEAQLRAETVESDLRRGQQQMLHEVRKKQSSLEIELADARSALKMSEMQISQTREQYKVEVEELKTEIVKARREKELANGKIREIEFLLDGEKRKNSSLQTELKSRLNIADTKVRESRNQISTLESKLQFTTDNYTELRNSLRASKETQLQLELKLKEQIGFSEALKREFQTQVEAIGPAYKEKTEVLRKKWKAALCKEKKRADAYRTKALDAHQRMKSFTSAVDINTPVFSAVDV